MGSMTQRGEREGASERCARVAVQAGRRHCADGAAAHRAVRTAIAAASLMLGSGAAFSPLPRPAPGVLAWPAAAACTGRTALPAGPWRVGSPRASKLPPVRASGASEGAAASGGGGAGGAQAAAKTGPLATAAVLVGKVWRLGTPFWGGPNKAKALTWTVCTVLLALVTTIYSVSISFVQKFFWNALNAKDLPKFNKFLLLYLGILTIGPPLLVLFDWCKARMALAWRNDLTSRYLGDYVDKMRYYKLPLVSQLDNTDQRIAEDIQNFCDKAVSLFCTCIVSVCDLAVFSVILYKIYPPLFGVLIAYASIGTGVTIFLGRPLITMNRQQLKKEADFRFDLIHVREAAESIAFYNGEKREGQVAASRFADAIANKRGLVNFERNLNFFTRWYKYLVQILPAVVIGPQYFAGKVPLGSISQSFFSFNHVLADLSIVVNEFTGPNGISSFSAQVERLDQLRIAVAEVDALESIDASDRITQITDAPSGTLSLQKISVLTPTGAARELIAELDLEIAGGQRLLVVGRSGVGKSSLMRVVAGLWAKGSGTVTRPPPSQTLFLSQKPYITLGSLRENVLYPSADADTPDDEILAALEKVNLKGVSERVGGLDAAERPLQTILSLGEQQRLAFARLLLARPTLVILNPFDIANVLLMCC
jgi:vitamin B12/bleomycin/antimicrobial peptide transport system ATP-binding/permease protein